VGTAAAILSKDAEPVREIGHFGIDLIPSARKLGYGLQIARALLSFYRENGIDDVVLAVDAGNASVARSLRSIGGERLDDVPASAGNPARARYILKK
jgi:predicted acetyltransferase